MYVDNLKLAGKTENIEPTRENFSWKTLTRANQHHSLTMYIWVALNIKSARDIVANYRDMFESKSSAGAKEILPTRASGKPDAETISSWSYDMEGHAKECVERYCELANKTTQQ